MTFACMECGNKFRTTKAAEKAAWDGCPKCGGCDIDVEGFRGLGSLRLADISIEEKAEAAYTKYKATKAN